MIGGGIAISVNNQATAQNMTVNAGSASNGAVGISAQNLGTGFTSVTVAGPVTTFSGIIATNAGTDLTVTTNGALTPSGSIGNRGTGISAQNSGTGATTVTANASVSNLTYGIIAYNGTSSGTNSNGTVSGISGGQGTDLTVNATTVTARDNGIFAINSGTSAGATSVTASGAVSATNAYGVLAVNGNTTFGATGLLQVTAVSAARDLTVNTAAVTGGHSGIIAVNSGSGGGLTSVTATGDVVGTGFYGILATNGLTSFSSANGAYTGVFGPSTSFTSGLTVNALGAVTGGDIGIVAENRGLGATNVTVGGTVSGNSFGILSNNFGTDLTINAAAVTATSGVGIAAFNVVTPGGTYNMTVDATDVSGGTYGIDAHNLGVGLTAITTTGNVIGIQNDGIRAFNGTDAIDLAVNAAAVSGGANGINAENRGSGTTHVVATGDVVGTRTYGIVAVTGAITFNPDGTVASVAPATGTDLTVDAVNVSGGVTGIYAVNEGVAGTSAITATGVVTGASGDGIYVSSRGGTQLNNTATTLTVDAATVSGGVNGIFAQNLGYGVTAVTASGPVVGSTGMGLYAYADQAVTVNATSVSGGTDGIRAISDGSGVTNVTATDIVSGGSGTGIFARTRGAGAAPADAGLIVNATAVSGGTTGIYADNQGQGAANVTATGTVTGGTTDGIHAFNTTTATDLTINAVAVSGGTNGVFADNHGHGATNVTVTGNVSGQSQYGILAVNDFSATSIAVNAVGVTGATGITVQNDGSGATQVVASGPVRGTTGDGIIAFNGGTATSLALTAGAVSGAQHGIDARNFGMGPLSISTSGLVEGGVSAIAATSGGQAIAINTSGVVRNRSQLSTALAVEATGGPVTFTNAGGLLGTVRFGAGAHSFNNNATWNTAGGTNEFGGGASQLVNASGVTIVAAANGGALETTAFNGLANFTNRGIVTLQDGGAGDTARFGGNFIAGPTAIQAIDINKAGQFDSIKVDGTATITGMTLNVANQGGYSVGRYPVLNAAGGLMGTYAAVTGSVGQMSAFVSVGTSYDANNAYLDVTKFRNFADAGFTPNQISTGRGLDTIPTAGLLFDAVAGLQTDAAARAAFDMLSGEVHASAKTALIENGSFIRDAVNDRIRQAFDAVGTPSMPLMSFAPDATASSPATDAMASAMPVKALPLRARDPASSLTVWGQGFGSWGHTDGDGNAARLNRSNGGVITGFDGVVAQSWRLGLMGGYSHTDFNVRDRASSGDSENYHIGAYGGTQWGALGLRAGASYTLHTITTARSVNIPGFADSLKADYNAGTAQVFGELGYRIDVRRVAFEPFVNLAYVNLSTDSFKEQGGAAALTGTATDTSATFTTLGLHAATTFAIGTVNATARGTLGWRHAFDDVTPLSSFAFASGGAFTIAGTALARESALFEGGLDIALTPAATLGLSYSGQIADSAADQSVRGNLAVKF